MGQINLLIQRWGPWLYGSLFIVLLPAMLVLWASRLESVVRLPLPIAPALGGAIAIAGLTLMLWAIRDLWVLGNGLPMNAYPPLRRVQTSSYALFSHPIYVGFVFLVAGCAISASSSAGFWLVTPMLCLCVIALVVGYEGPATRKRFGPSTRPTPLFSMPTAQDQHVTWLLRVMVLLMALAPWSILYSLFSQWPIPEGAISWYMAWEFALPRHPHWVWMYSTAYAVAALGPLLLNASKDLRRYVKSAWIATLFGFGLMLVFPGEAEWLSLPELSAYPTAQTLLEWNRVLDSPWLAMPSFHMLWTTLFALCLARRGIAGVWFGAGVVLAMGMSCLGTGSHALIDIVAGVGLGIASWYHDQIWHRWVHWSERFSNTWSSIRIGPLRIIAHAIWSAIAAFLAMLFAAWLVGPERTPWLFLVFLVALFCAGLWGYWLEGGSRLSRPFGYYGFLLGAMCTLGILYTWDASIGASLTTAFACAAPLAQAFGRLRCMVQGCCHGRPVLSALGIRVTHPSSRVTKLSALGGIPIHPTQLYSLLGNALLFALLWRLWRLGVSAFLIGGLYLMLSSLTRFMEEQYRGEVQTKYYTGLSVYQWFALGVFFFGMILSMFTTSTVQVTSPSLSASGVGLALLAALLAAFSMSMDFPDSSRRFSRLTVD